MSSDKVDDLSDFHLSEMTETAVTVEPEAASKMMRSFHGPLAVDQALRSAVSVCWMMLPEDRKNPDALEREIRRLLDRVIANLREDTKAFGA